MAGTNGTVTKCSTASNGAHTVTVHFPGDPNAVPPIPDSDEVYDPVPQEQYDDFKDALCHDLRVDTTGTAPAVGNVSLHK